MNAGIGSFTPGPHQVNAQSPIRPLGCSAMYPFRDFSNRLDQNDSLKEVSHGHREASDP